MNCPHCTHGVPDALTQCPHCGLPALSFPNVSQAARQVEVDAVAQRHQGTLATVAKRGCGAVGHLFETAVAASTAVIGRPIDEALRLVKSDNEAYATFYNLLHAGIRLPDGDRWTRLRGLADWELFGPARDQMRFAALSLDGSAPANYGEVSLELSEPMIAHRATVFEENSAVFFEKQRQQGIEPPTVTGHRARWCDRGKLALAKHAHELTPASKQEDFPSMLLRSGLTGADDVFIEVHVYGSLTRRSLSRVSVAKTRARKATVTDLRDRLMKVGVAVEVR